MALKAGDMPSTGPGIAPAAEAERSLVKLGEKGSLELKESAAPPAPGETWSHGVADPKIVS